MRLMVKYRKEQTFDVFLTPIVKATPAIRGFLHIIAGKIRRPNYRLPRKTRVNPHTCVDIAPERKIYITDTRMMRPRLKAKFHYASLFRAGSELAPNQFGAC